MLCEVCGKTEQLKTCAKCLRANYCSREHQIAHWQIHRQWCIPVNTDSSLSSELNDNQNTNTLMHDQNQLNIGDYYEQTPSMNYPMDSISQTFDISRYQQSDHSQQQQLQQQQQININPENITDFNTLSETVNPFNQGFNDGAYPQQNQVFGVSQNDQLPIMNSPNLSTSSTSNLINSQQNTAQLNFQPDFIIQNLNRYCQMILSDMNQYGFCVIDDFLQNGDQILSEVLALYHNGRFRNGQVVNSKKTPDAKLIRGDQIVWVEYSEPMCNNIGYLIRILDSIITRCNSTMSGEFAKYNISRRTKAMIACYPGNFSKYVRHIDNPNNDGRCITSIYYLNKNYHRQSDGGVLRLFPQMNNSIVADVEPKFNRVIFFWSDRRNPHEVMPSARMRFAITVWYFDENERAKAIEKIKQTNPQYPNDKVLVPF